jgi:arabinofuranosyltransferase
LNTADRSPSRVRTLAFAVLALAYALLAAHFDWMCDDAFISLRYARNLALGNGLVFNPGEAPPVEGYTNLLWVLWLTPFEFLGLDAPLAARWTSATCGMVLALLVARATSHAARNGLGALCAMALLVTLPPFVVWSTSGLETMAFSLALFATFAALAGKRPRAWIAALAGSSAVLLRADGFAFVALVLAASFGAAWFVRCRERRNAVLRAGLVVGVVVAAHFLWRRTHYGEWVPNTARVKVEFGAAALANGAKYVGTFVASFPSVLVAALVALWLAVRTRQAHALAALAVVLGVLSYATLVGGDFMAFGRFLVPALAFLAFAFGVAVASRDDAQPRAWIAPLVATCACVALSLPAGWNAHVAPAALREKLRFRWNNPLWLSEHQQWVMMRDQARLWSFLGRALKARTQPGESLVVGTIGATGYYSDLWIHDPFGLVNREEFAPLTEEARRTPGHQRRVPLETFLAKHPTYLEAALVLRDQPYADFRPGSVPGGLKSSKIAEPEWVEVGDVPQMPEALVLRLTRYKPR